MIRHYLKLFFVWLIASPDLLSKKYSGNKFLRFLFVLFSPFTVFFLITIAIPILGVIGMSLGPITNSWKTEHNFKNADEISRFTSSYIPPCDTLTSEYHSVGIDGSEVETFRLHHPLTRRERRKMKANLLKGDNWSETDSTFEYYRSDTVKIDLGRNKCCDAVRVSVPKTDSIMTIECIHY